MIKGRDRLSNIFELKVRFCRDKLKDPFDTMIRHFYGVQFLSKSVKSFCNISPWLMFQPAEESFLKLFNNTDKTCKQNNFKLICLK